ncbi:MAG: benzoylformate decarboxylase [Mycobacterium sp.]|uniref:benzoylformate decarboxylase n=1 Tax=Mycobacterium sp. TaxID=1785 RepID=UPI0028B9A5CB|nr:benzoylformate decarboxylase [Mycobacterium sp.]
MATVHEATWQLIRALGVHKVFGNPGSTEMPFLADFPEDLDYVLGLHEGAVIGMADVYAQLTGEPTLVNLHTAVGLGNGMGAVINAARGHSPLVITAGQQVRATLTMEPLLANPDPTTLPRPAVKWAFEPPRAQDVPAALARAVRYAALPPAGPVFVSLPMDDFEQPAEAGTTELLAARRLTGRSVPARVELNALAKRLAAARNPVLVVGAGLDATPGGFEAGIALAHRQNLPVWLAPNSSRVGFPTDHPHFRGSLPAGIAWLSESLAGHDLILVAGAPVFQYYPYAPGNYLPPGAELVAIVDDPDAAARAPVGDALVADPALALLGLLELLPQTSRPAPAPRAALEIPLAVDTLTASQVYNILGPLLPHNGIVVMESMNGAPAMWDRMKFRRSGSFFFCAAGGLGFAVPGAVGAQLAQPERPVLAVSGDGGAQYGIQGLYTAASRRLPITFLILVNREYGILKGFGDYLTTTGVPGLDLDYLDYQALAKGYGIPAVRTGRPDELAIAVKQAFTADNGPHMIIVDVEPGVPLGG